VPIHTAPRAEWTLTAPQISPCPQSRCQSRPSSHRRLASHHRPHRTPHRQRSSSTLPSSNSPPRPGRVSRCESSPSATQRRIPGAARTCTKATTTRATPPCRPRRTAQMRPRPREPRASSPPIQPPTRRPTKTSGLARWAAKEAGEATMAEGTSHSRLQDWATVASARLLLAVAPILHLSWAGQLVA
jgi:hypothetical protein